MPVRLTARGSLLIAYDDESRTWVSIAGIAFCVLPHHVDIEPGVTLGHVFELVERDPLVKRFLADYCSCDIDALHQKPRQVTHTIQVSGVERTPDGSSIATGEAAADILLISPHFWAYTDQTGDRRLDGGYMLLARSSKYP